MTDLEKKIKKSQRRKVIYVIVACVLILLNVITDFLSYIEGEFRRYPEDSSSRIGYFLGSHIFIIFGLFLFYRVFKINKQITYFRKRQFDMVVDSVGSDLLKE
jgi:uncharacterized membrane protein